VRQGASLFNWLVLLTPFYAVCDSGCFSAPGPFSLLLFEINALVLMPGDRLANLGRRLAELGLLIGVEAFLGAGGAFRSMQSLEAAAQARMPQGAIAATVAGQLVDHAADLGHLLIDVYLPVKTKILTGQLIARHNGGERRELKGSRRMIGGHIVCGVGPLCVADHRGRGDHHAQDPPALHPVPHKDTHLD